MFRISSIPLQGLAVFCTSLINILQVFSIPLLRAKGFTPDATALIPWLTID